MYNQSMHEASSPSAPLGGEELIRQIEIQVARSSVVIELADLAIERSTATTERIQREMEESQPGIDEALTTLRRAGLLRP